MVSSLKIDVLFVYWFLVDAKFLVKNGINIYLIGGILIFVGIYFDYFLNLIKFEWLLTAKVHCKFSKLQLSLATVLS